MLEYFNIGFRAENGVQTLQNLKPKKKYSLNDIIIEDILEIAENSKRVMTNGGYNDALIPYYHIFLEPFKNKGDLERMTGDLKMATKTINTLYKLKSSKKVSEDELKNARDFFDLIGNRCLILESQNF